MEPRRWAPIRDALLPAFAIAVTVVDLLVSGEGKQPGAAAAALALASAATVALAHRLPLAALTASGAIGLTLVASGYRLHSTAVAPAVALYAVARTGRRTRTVAIWGLATVAAMVAEPLVTDVSPLSLDTWLNVFLIAIPLLLGEVVRAHHSYVELLLERIALAKRSREETVLRRVEEERLRIARDLHDVVAHTLTTINVQAGVAAHRREPERAYEALALIKETSREALEELRGVVGVLRGDGDEEAPTMPAPQLDALAVLAEETRRQGIDVELAVGGEPPETVPEAIQLAAFRIVQESLTNVLRHAGPVETKVEVDIGRQLLHLRVRNARGTATTSADGAGAGIVGMRERAAAVGGSLTAARLPDHGFEVTADLPYRRRG